MVVANIIFLNVLLAAAKTSRDSGLGSADPSPNTTNSTPGSSTPSSCPSSASPADSEKADLRPRPKSFSVVQRSSSMENMLRKASPARSRPSKSQAN